MNCCPQNQIYPSFEVGLKKNIFSLKSQTPQPNLSCLRKSDCQCRVRKRRTGNNAFRRYALRIALLGITYIKMIGRGLKPKTDNDFSMIYRSSPPSPSAYLLLFLGFFFHKIGGAF